MPVGTMDPTANGEGAVSDEAIADVKKAKPVPRAYCVFVPGAESKDLKYIGEAKGLTREAALDALLDSMEGDQGETFFAIASRTITAQTPVTETKVSRTWK